MFHGAMQGCSRVVNCVAVGFRSMRRKEYSCTRAELRLHLMRKTILDSRSYHLGNSHQMRLTGPFRYSREECESFRLGR
jgi:hypothetical protein